MKILKRLLRNNNGFTLVELMTVVIIIGILATIALPQFSKQTDKARSSRSQSELSAIKTVIEVWAQDPEKGKSRYPSTTDELKKALSDGGYEWDNLKDPWDNGYGYFSSADKKSYKLATKGVDGLKNSDDDISVTEKKNPTFESVDITTTIVSGGGSW